MQFAKHVNQHGASYAVDQDVVYNYEGHAGQWRDDPLEYEFAVHRVYVPRAGAVRVYCCGELTEVANQCAPVAELLRPVLQQLAVASASTVLAWDNTVYGTADGGTYVLLERS
jgi:hypothetical protein